MGTTDEKVSSRTGASRTDPGLVSVHPPGPPSTWENDGSGRPIWLADGEPWATLFADGLVRPQMPRVAPRRSLRGPDAHRWPRENPDAAGALVWAVDLCGIAERELVRCTQAAHVARDEAEDRVAQKRRWHGTGWQVDELRRAQADLLRAEAELNLPKLAGAFPPAIARSTLRDRLAQSRARLAALGVLPWAAFSDETCHVDLPTTWWEDERFRGAVAAWRGGELVQEYQQRLTAPARRFQRDLVRRGRL